MKTGKQGVLTIVVCLLFAFTVHTFAIEGLKVSVQSTNVVLYWPSVVGETYVVQYRAALSTGSWQTLVSALPAATGTNVTYFIHTNMVPGGGGTFASMSVGGNEMAAMSMAAVDAEPVVPLATGTNSWAKEYPWSGLGNFVVACSAADANPTKTYRIKLMVAGGPGGEYGGVNQTLGYYGLGLYQLSPGNGQGDAFLMGDGTTKASLLSYLSGMSYRNFYYFGHGAPSSIGGAWGTTTPTITTLELQHILNNSLSSAKPANYHPYRLVFIDGCQTGTGNMCEKFGIPAQTVNTNFFNFAGVRSRAFLGFKKNISYNDAQWTWRSLMLGGFFGDWQDQNKNLYICVSNAVNGVHSSGFQKMDSSWVIYGATNLNIYSP